jgi:hypothetical protein
MLGVAETTGYAFDVLGLAVEPLASRVGDRMLVVGQDVVDVPTMALASGRRTGSAALTADLLAGAPPRLSGRGT